MCLFYLSKSEEYHGIIGCNLDNWCGEVDLNHDVCFDLVAVLDLDLDDRSLALAVLGEDDDNVAACVVIAAAGVVVDAIASAVDKADGANAAREVNIAEFEGTLRPCVRQPFRFDLGTVELLVECLEYFNDRLTFFLTILDCCRSPL